MKHLLRLRNPELVWAAAIAFGVSELFFAPFFPHDRWSLLAMVVTGTAVAVAGEFWGHLWFGAARDDERKRVAR